MTHPIFDKARFPRAREDARTFLQKLKEVVPERQRIVALYEASGGQRGQINTDQAADFIWDEAIQALATRGLVRALCAEIMRDEQYRLLREPTQALIDADQAQGAAQPPPPPLDPAQFRLFLGNCISRAAAVHGLTVLISPYAAFDAHSLDDPRQLGEQVFLHSFEQRLQQFLADQGGDGEQPAVPDFGNDILSNFLVASAGSYAISADYDSVWELVCGVGAGAAEDEPLDLHRELTRLAEIAQDVFRNRNATLEWSGLLLVSFDVTSRLESALDQAGVEFGLLRLLKDGSVAHNRHLGDMHFAPAETLPASGDPGILAPVMVLKLLGARFLQEDRQRPMLGLEVLGRARTISSLPRLLQLHLQQKPFAMIGGGLIDPFVALSFEALIRPAFAEGAEVAVKKSRWIVLHPAANPASVVRTVESAIDHLNPEWTDVFELRRVVHSLPEAVREMSVRLSDAADAAGG